MLRGERSISFFLVDLRAAFQLPAFIVHCEERRRGHWKTPFTVKLRWLVAALIGVRMNSTNVRSQLRKLLCASGRAEYRRAVVSKVSAGRPVTSRTSLVGAPKAKALCCDLRRNNKKSAHQESANVRQGCCLAEYPPWQVNTTDFPTDYPAHDFRHLAHRKQRRSGWPISFSHMFIWIHECCYYNSGDIFVRRRSVLVITRDIREHAEMSCVSDQAQIVVGKIYPAFTLTCATPGIMENT